MSAASSWFQRYLLPGFAFKAVIIGGGYATGREMVEFFLPAGPRGGVQGIVLAMLIWCAVCVVTFMFARLTHSADYRTFFRHLLGRAWFVFEICFLLGVMLTLAVFGAASGAIGTAVLGWPTLAGTLCLVAGIALVTMYGTAAVEQLFKWVSFFLYGVYALFVVLALSKFGDRVLANFALDTPTDGWFVGGLAYSGYNAVGAVVILPVLRHLTSHRDAVIAGLLSGPLAMLPALLFFVCMVAFYPEIGRETLPSDFLLQRLGVPVFHLIFQSMIFLALLESGTGAVHAVNERVAEAWLARTGRVLAPTARLASAAVVLVGAIFVADRFGLIALVARGYRTLSWVMIGVYLLPVMTYGVWRVWRGSRTVP